MANEGHKSAKRSDDAQATKSKKTALDLGPLEGNVGFHLRLASIAMERSRKQKTGTDLPLGHFPVLFIISLNPEATQTAIAEAVGLRRSSLVPVLKKLEEYGWIERAGDREDKRANRIRLTPEGETACVGLLSDVTLIEDLAKTKLGSRDYARLVGLLKKVQDALAE